MLGWDIRESHAHIEFFLYLICVDDIAQLDTFLKSLPAYQTPTWVGSGGEEADRDGFGDPKSGWNAS